LIRRWNERVKPEDIVYHLGDFCFRRTKYVVDGEEMKYKEEVTRGYEYYASQLNGKIILIKGNHDSRKDTGSLLTSATINYGGIDWFLQHEPVARFKFNMHGHVHNLWKVKRQGPSILVNVGVDVWDFYPVSISEILEAIYP